MGTLISRCCYTAFSVQYISRTIDKQKTLRRDYIYNIENTDIEIGISGVYLHLLLYYFGMHDLLILHVLHINLLK